MDERPRNPRKVAGVTAVYLTALVLGAVAFMAVYHENSGWLRLISAVYIAVWQFLLGMHFQTASYRVDELIEEAGKDTNDGD